MRADEVGSIGFAPPRADLPPRPPPEDRRARSWVVIAGTIALVEAILFLVAGNMGLVVIATYPDGSSDAGALAFGVIVVGSLGVSVAVGAFRRRRRWRRVGIGYGVALAALFLVVLAGSTLDEALPCLIFATANGLAAFGLIRGRNTFLPPQPPTPPGTPGAVPPPIPRSTLLVGLAAGVRDELRPSAKPHL